MSNNEETYAALFEKSLARIEELEAEVRTLRGGGAGEPVAIIGMGCRFPGADGPEEYWDLLYRGADATGPAPRGRLHPGQPAAAGAEAGHRGGYVGGLAGFDAEFFRTSPREAARIDPQHRLLLEVAWEAVENAGRSPADLPQRTGVYVGIGNSDYREAAAAQGPAAVDEYFSSGATASTASGRLSYFLGLSGPSLSIDTACSSSAVAVHLAVRALRSGECGMALVGGVNRIITPHEGAGLAAAGMLAADGRCKPFDAAADGYGRAEGCGMLVLKPLSAAERDRDRVLGVVLGSAVNQDGRRAGLTVPHGAAQQDVVRAAMADAGVGPDDIGYVEAQGTGTALGDRIEAAALSAVFGGRGHPLPVGSAKSNLGHMEAAAGVGGLMKAVLSQNAGIIPATLHFRDPDPHIPWDDIPLRVSAHRSAWPAGDRICGVSSFGFGGTNCHVVVGQAPAPARTPAGAERPCHVLALSAVTEEALRELAGRYLARFGTGDAAAGPGPIGDICFTANTGRAHFAHRLCTAAADMRELTANLADWLGDRDRDRDRDQGRDGRDQSEEQDRSGGRDRRRGAAPPAVRSRVHQGTARGTGGPRVLAYFPGGAALYPQAGSELYAVSAAFRRALARCAGMWAARTGEPAKPGPLLRAEPADTAYSAGRRSRFALFALEYGLLEVWRSWGIDPEAATGHGTGRHVAAYAAGEAGLADCIDAVLAGDPDPDPDAADPPLPAETRSDAVLVLGPGPGPAAVGTAAPPVLSGIGPGAEWRRMLEALGALYVRGAPVRWEALDDGDAGRRRLDLPTYPFQRTPHWFPQEPAAVADGNGAAGRLTGRSLPATERWQHSADGSGASVEAAEALVRETLGIGGRIDPHGDLFDLGMDSLLAAELRERLRAASGCDLPDTVVYDHPTIAGLLGAIGRTDTGTR